MGNPGHANPVTCPDYRDVFSLSLIVATCLLTLINTPTQNGLLRMYIPAKPHSLASYCIIRWIIKSLMDGVTHEPDSVEGRYLKILEFKICLLWDHYRYET